MHVYSAEGEGELTGKLVALCNTQPMPFIMLIKSCYGMKIFSRFGSAVKSSDYTQNSNWASPPTLIVCLNEMNTCEPYIVATIKCVTPQIVIN